MERDFNELKAVYGSASIDSPDGNGYRPCGECPRGIGAGLQAYEWTAGGKPDSSRNRSASNLNPAV
ncbi:hypothetical protein [Pedobacter sp. BS3]|uniref:hypothetical protein n=1 Tax=Pedobacter sp. BS3 TaxID=2567937 RepID=UPI001658F415|nr:hypothetical protein [Pedobacter sp. BS3]